MNIKMLWYRFYIKFENSPIKFLSKIVFLGMRYTKIISNLHAGFVYTINDKVKSISFRLQIHMVNRERCVGIVWGKLSKIC